MSQSYWRDKAAPIIARVLIETAGQPEKAIKKALRAAFPFGPYEMYPVRIWLDEIKRQRGQKPKLGTRTKPMQPKEPEDTQTLSMFGAK